NVGPSFAPVLLTGMLDAEPSIGPFFAPLERLLGSVERDRVESLVLADDFQQCTSSVPVRNVLLEQTQSLVTDFECQYKVFSKLRGQRGLADLLLAGDQNDRTAEFVHRFGHLIWK